MELRKEISELVALYSLEPQLRDVYVEGIYDKNLIDWFLMDQGIDGICVYSVDAINVPDGLIARHNLDLNCSRSRVIALAKELFAQLPSDRKIICVADRDHEDYFPTDQKDSYLAFTDYTSVDLYLWRKRTVQKFISLVLGGFPISADQLMGDIVDTLQELFLLRLTNKALDWNMKWIPFEKYVHINGGIKFAFGRFLTAYLQKNGRSKQRETFEKKLSEFRNRLKDDPRLSIRGHDLMELLFHLAKKRRASRRFCDVETFQGAITGCLEAQDIHEESLFQRILALKLRC